MDLQQLDLDLLVVLDALHTERTVGAVARRLKVSQPTVSFSLRKLRDFFLPPGARSVDQPATYQQLVRNILPGYEGPRPLRQAKRRMARCRDLDAALRQDVRRNCLRSCSAQPSRLANDSTRLSAEDLGRAFA